MECTLDYYRPTFHQHEFDETLNWIQLNFCSFKQYPADDFSFLMTERVDFIKIPQTPSCWGFGGCKPFLYRTSGV